MDKVVTLDIIGKDLAKILTGPRGIPHQTGDMDDGKPWNNSRPPGRSSMREIIPVNNISYVR